MRRILSLASAVVAAVGLVGAAVVAPAGAGASTTHIVVKKAVVGTATGPFKVNVTCTPDDSWTLNFDSSGKPTTADAGWTAVDGAWVLNEGTPPEPVDCTATETAADGATSTSWTCDFETNAVEQLGGCDAASGTGTGPVAFTLDGVGAEVSSQTATVEFTNTVAPPTTTTTAPAPVEVGPTFTG